MGLPGGRLFSSSIDGSVSEWDLYDLKQKVNAFLCSCIINYRVLCCVLELSSSETVPTGLAMNPSCVTSRMYS